MGTTVMVVGVGRFGGHYARILSGLNAGRSAAARPLERLVLTRTRRGPARRLAEQVQSDPACTVPEVIGISVAGPQDLAAAVKRFSPDLTCITATDPEAGDAIHWIYAEIALRHGGGRLLCEKPLCPTTGDGRSLSAVGRLRRAGGSARFGLELPMGVVRRRMEADADLGPRLKAARRLSFFWSTNTPLREDLADTLALHPFSLVPENLIPERASGRAGPGRFDVAGRFADRDIGRSVDVTMTLRTGSDLRAMAIDGYWCVFSSTGAQVTVLAGRDPSAGSTVDPAPKRSSAIPVDNPLRENITASLAGAPVTGLDRTAASQRFLEMVKGWRT